MQVKIKIDPASKILLKRSLQKGGKVQKFFTHEVRRRCDKYVPFRDGPLKNTAVEQEDRILYNTPYAAKQYYNNGGNGQDGMSSGSLRGKLWDKRMMAAEGDKVVEAVADYAGGKTGK